MSDKPITDSERSIIVNELSEIQFNYSNNPNATLKIVIADLRELADWIEAGMPDESEAGS